MDTAAMDPAAMDTAAPLRFAVLAGDGIGPEIVPAATEVAGRALAAHGIRAEFTTLPYGRSAIDSHGAAVPDVTLAELPRHDLWIVGPHDNASYPESHRTGAIAPGGLLRKHFGLNANLRPARALPGVPATAPGIDVLIVRENSEGLYADRNMAVGSGEFQPTADVALAVGLITRGACEAIAHEAFRAARDRRRHVTIVHKANVLRLTTGLFRDVCYEIAAHYPDVTVDDQHVDAMAALLVRRPADFDVLVTENLFGDILSDLAGELAGSLGLAPSLNCSARHAMAQAVHGAAPDIAGSGRANPIAMISSVAMALRWYGRRTGDDAVAGAGEAIRAAVETALAAGVRTADLGGGASTGRCTASILDVI